jgi:DnaJ-class molecular chaperone
MNLDDEVTAVTMWRVCPECDGQGFDWNDEGPCGRCDGYGEARVSYAKWRQGMQAEGLL